VDFLAGLWLVACGWGRSVFGWRPSASPAGGNFLFWQKRNSRKKVAWESQTSWALERAIASLGHGGHWRFLRWLAWFALLLYRSFANSFTLCLIGWSPPHHSVTQWVAWRFWWI